jgi:hypothetical protein
MLQYAISVNILSQLYSQLRGVSVRLTLEVLVGLCTLFIHERSAMTTQKGGLAIQTIKLAFLELTLRIYRAYTKEWCCFNSVHY